MSSTWTTIDIPKWIEERSWGLNPTQGTTGSWGKLEAAEVVFFGEKHTNWLSNTKGYFPKSYIKITKRLNKMCLGIHIHIFI